MNSRREDNENLRKKGKREVLEKDTNEERQRKNKNDANIKP